MPTENKHKVVIQLAVGGSKEVDKSFQDLTKIAEKTGGKVGKVFDVYNKKGTQLKRTVEILTNTIKQADRLQNSVKSKEFTDKTSKGTDFAKIEREKQKAIETAQKQAVAKKLKLEKDAQRRLEQQERASFQKRKKTASTFLQQRLKVSKAILNRELAIHKDGANSITALRAKFARKQLDIEGTQLTRLKEITDRYLSNRINFNRYSSEIAKTTKTARESLTKLHAELNSGIASGQRFESGTARHVAAVQRRIDLEKDIIERGEQGKLNSIAKLNAKRLQAERILQGQLTKLQNQVRRGSISASAGEVKRNQLLNKYEATLKRINSLTSRNTSLVNQQVNANKSLLRKIGEVVVGYRAVNSAINLGLRALKEIPSQGLQEQATEASLSGVFGSVETTFIKKEIEDIANLTGQVISTMEKQYRQFAPSAKIAGLAQETVNQVFEDFTVVGTVLHRTRDQMDSVFVALDQIFSKGVAQSEELKRQLGNQLPAVIEIAAKSMDLLPGQFFEAMRKNEIIATEFVPKFSALYRKIFSGDQDQVLLTLQDQLFVAYTRTLNQYTQVTRKVFREVERVMVTALKGAENILKFFNEEFNNVVLVSKAVSSILITRVFTAITAVSGATLKQIALNVRSTASYVALNRATSASTLALGKHATMLARVNALATAGIARASGLTVALTGLSAPFLLGLGIPVTIGALALFNSGMIKNKELIAVNKDRILELRESYKKAFAEGSTASEEFKKSIKEQLVEAEKGLIQGKQFVLSYKDQEVSVKNLAKAIGINLLNGIKTLFSETGKVISDIGLIIKGLGQLAGSYTKVLSELGKTLFKNTTKFGVDFVNSVIDNVNEAVKLFRTLKSVSGQILSGNIRDLQSLKAAFDESAKSQENVLKNISVNDINTSINQVKDSLNNATKVITTPIKSVFSEINDSLSLTIDDIVKKASKLDISEQLERAGRKNLIDPTDISNQGAIAEQKVLEKVEKTRLTNAINLQKSLSKQLKATYEDGLIPMEEFYNKQEAFIRKQIDLEIAFTQEKQRQAQATLSNLPASSPERAAIQSEIIDLRNEIATLENDKASKLIELRTQQREDEIKYQESLFKTQEVLLELQGKFVQLEQARQAAEANSPERIRIQTEANNGDEEARKALIRQDNLNKEALLAANLNEIIFQRDILESQLQAKIEVLQNKRIQGHISDRQQLVLTRLETEKFGKELDTLLKDKNVSQIILQSQDAKLKQDANNLIGEVKRINAEVKSDGQKVRDFLQSSLANSFQGYLTGAQTAREATTGLISHILSEVAKLAAVELATQVIGILGSSTGIGGGTTGTVSGASSGGGIGDVLLGLGQGLSTATIAPPPLTSNKKDIPSSVQVPNIIQNITINISEVENESPQEQTDRLAKALNQQMKGLIKTEISESVREGNLFRPTKLKAF